MNALILLNLVTEQFPIPSFIKGKHNITLHPENNDELSLNIWLKEGRLQPIYLDKADQQKDEALLVREIVGFLKVFNAIEKPEQNVS